MISSEPRDRRDRRRPAALLATSGLLVAVALLAAWSRAWPFAVYLAAAGAFPLTCSARQFGWGSALTYGAFGWHLLGLAPTVSGLTYEGLYGGPPWLFGLALGVSITRVIALRSEATTRWLQAGADARLAKIV